MKARQRNKFIKKYNLQRSVLVISMKDGKPFGEWINFNLKKLFYNRHQLDYAYKNLPSVPNGEGVAQFFHFAKKPGMRLEAEWSNCMDNTKGKLVVR